MLSASIIAILDSPSLESDLAFRRISSQIQDKLIPHRQGAANLADQPVNLTLRFTDLIGGETTRAFQEGISTITNVSTVICDHMGRPVIGPSGPIEAWALLQASTTGRERLAAILEQLTADPDSHCHPILGFQAAEIRYDRHRLGSIVSGPVLSDELNDRQLEHLAGEFDLSHDQIAELGARLNAAAPADRSTALHLIRLMADIISKLAAQADDLHHREIELGTVHTLTDLLSGTQDLQLILDTISRQVCQVMQVKASSIRLLDEQTNELCIKSVYNLSNGYLNKGPVMLDENPIDRAAFAGQAVYVADAGTDPRIRFPEQAQREGIVSGLSVGMTYRGQTIGVMRVYTDHRHVFTAAETALLRSIASQATSAIINSRLYLEALQAERYQQQLKHAGEIQRRMIPDQPPEHPKIAFAYVYEPSAEVGGDFFDFYTFPDSQQIGLCIADVVGKGMPAALMMASLRTAFRLYAHSIMEITEIMTLINIHMTRETLIGEFATMFYGTFSENGRKLTYCCAGHDPPMHYRKGQVKQLTTGDFVIGVEPNESFSKKALTLKKDDVIIFYTDGIVDAQNFEDRKFGRQRLTDSLRKYAAAPVSQIAQNIIWDVRRFVGLADQADDITLVVAKIR